MIKSRIFKKVSSVILVLSTVYAFSMVSCFAVDDPGDEESSSPLAVFSNSDEEPSKLNNPDNGTDAIDRRVFAEGLIGYPVFGEPDLFILSKSKYTVKIWAFE